MAKKNLKKCESCGISLSKDEIALHYKIFEQEEIKNFFCLKCLSEYIECDVEDLKEAIRIFKEQGCQYFL